MEAAEAEKRWAWEAQQQRQPPPSQQALRIPYADSLGEQAGGSAARPLDASPPAPLASSSSLLSSLLDVNASFTWRGEDFSAPASRSQAGGQGPARGQGAGSGGAGSGGAGSGAGPFTAAPRAAHLSHAAPPAAHAARPGARPGAAEARHETRRARREARRPRADEPLPRHVRAAHSRATEHAEAELVDDISALQSEMDVLIGQHLGNLP